jgi:hypothetical protein
MFSSSQYKMDHIMIGNRTDYLRASITTIRTIGTAVGTALKISSTTRRTSRPWAALKTLQLGAVTGGRESSAEAGVMAFRTDCLSIHSHAPLT